MADTLTDLVARLRAAEPALADVPDDVLTAEVLTQLQARGGPSVGDALDLGATFRSTNEKTPEGAAVVRAPESAWTKAATIGAPGIGERYSFPSVGEVLASDQPLQLLAQFVTGHGRPRSVANADPLGVTAFHEGKGPMPMLMGSTEEVKGLLGSIGEEVGAAGRGLYSRVDDAVSLLPKNGAHPNKIAGILKSNASAEELAYRQVPEFLASKGNATVTPGELQVHLDAHPAPLPVVKTRGGGASAFRVVPTSEVATPAGLDFPPYAVINAEGTPLSYHQTAQAAQEGIAELPAMGIHGSGPETKYAQYQLPGGKDYQETLLTLPEKPPQALPEGYSIQPLVGDRRGAQFTLEGPDGTGYVLHASTPEQAHAGALNRLQSEGVIPKPANFRSSHFDDPNIVVHTRSNTRTLPTGERGRFVEEVQSDWHQKGKAGRYVDPKRPYSVTGVSGQFATEAEAREAARAANVPEHFVRNELRGEGPLGAVPDAPFKETWPDLGLKQQLLEAAKDPEAQWLGFTSGETQAARYDLSKQVSRVRYDPQTHYLEAFGLDGDRVIQQEGVRPEQVPDYIGKEPAKHLLTQPLEHDPADGTAYHTLSGVDLKVGGEGMRKFYDDLLPKRLQKIVKPFGGTVERTTLKQPLYDIPTQTKNLKEAAPIWMVRLTPAMKARILKEGLPLGLLLGAAGPSVAEALGGDHTNPP